MAEIAIVSSGLSSLLMPRMDGIAIGAKPSKSPLLKIIRFLANEARIYKKKSFDDESIRLSFSHIEIFHTFKPVVKVVEMY